MRSEAEIRERLAKCNEVLARPSIPESVIRIQATRKVMLEWVLGEWNEGEE